MGSSPDVVIRAQGVGKRYRLGHRRPSYGTLRETLVQLATRPAARVLQLLRGGARSPRKEWHWALRDLDLEVRRGEVMGVVGRNGAGKSTLLKILSRITEPTTGKVELYGRVGSLLEVGTGFHPELSGRENIFLNGAILGMRKVEIERRFDEIVAFSEVERFIDMPVKRYSSGMYLRLAFAVAAHMEPEILLVDEVLAVGDLAFQRKCLGKMSEVSRAGRAVVLVSHSMASILRLCESAICLSGGRITARGEVLRVVEAYRSEHGFVGSHEEIADRIAALPVEADFRLHSVRVLQEGAPTTRVGNDRPVEIVVDFELRRTMTALRVYFDLCDEHGEILVRTFHDDFESGQSRFEAGRYRSVATIPANLLAPRRYLITLRCSVHNVGTLTGPGVPIELEVEALGHLNAAYPAPVVSRLQPPIVWDTRRVDRRAAADPG